MAGVKGRSGGARPGSGPKPKKAVGAPETGPAAPASPPASDAPAPVYEDSLSFLKFVMNDPLAPRELRVRSAITIAQYEHTRLADGGKKDLRKQRAARVGGGRFAPSAPPLKLVGKG